MTRKELEVIAALDKRKVVEVCACGIRKKNSKGDFKRCNNPPGEFFVYEDDGVTDISIILPCNMHVMDYLMAKDRSWKLLR